MPELSIACGAPTGTRIEQTAKLVDEVEASCAANPGERA